MPTAILGFLITLTLVACVAKNRSPSASPPYSFPEECRTASREARSATLLVCRRDVECVRQLCRDDQAKRRAE